MNKYNYLLALKGASDDLFALMTRLATEKTRSDGTLVAGTARTDLASAANFGPESGGGGGGAAGAA